MYNKLTLNKIVTSTIVLITVLTFIPQITSNAIEENCLKENLVIDYDCVERKPRKKCITETDKFPIKYEEVKNINSFNLFGFLDFLTPTANAQNPSKYHSNKSNNPEPMSKIHCNLYETYRPYILEGMRRYYPAVNPAVPFLSPSIIGGLMFQESYLGQINKPKGCAGRADYVSGKTADKRAIGYHGHGLGQADPSSQDGVNPKTGKPLLTPSWGTDIQVKVNYRGMEHYYYWADCRGGSMYAVGHLVKIMELAEPIAVKKLKAAGLDTKRDSQGFFVNQKVQKAYATLILDANNAGPTGMQNSCHVDKQAFVNEGCTENKHYAELIYKASLNMYKCFGLSLSMESQLNKIWNFE
jgi:hypothetical protein